jgi:peptidylprolyl isomerase
VRFLPALALAVALGVALGGCASAGAGAPFSALAPPARAADGLLGRADLQALVDLQVRRDAAGLTAALASADSVVRARAALALGSVQSADAVPALRALLDDPAATVRADAAFALGQSADSTAGVALIVSLRTESDAAVLVELLDALGKTGGHADLAALLGVPLPGVLEPARAVAVTRFALRGITSPTAATWAADRVQAADPALREAAASLFARAPVAGWAAEMPTLRNGFDGLVGDAARMHLARALGRRGDDQDAPRLAAALRTDPDWRIRVAAATALGAFLSSDAARAALLDALTDPSPHVGATAAESLTRAARLDDDAQARAARIVSDPTVSWTVQAPLLRLLARAGAADAVTGWSARQSSVFARTAATAALAAAPGTQALDALFADADAEEAVLATAAVSALRTRLAALPDEDRRAVAPRFFDAFKRALRRKDLAVTSAAAAALADSSLRALGPSPVLREVYAELSAPADIEPMVEIIKAVGQIRDGAEIDFLVGITLTGHPLLRRAARDALNDRLEEGIDVTLTGEDATPSTVAMDWEHLARVGAHPTLVLETTRGVIEVRLDTESAPQTVQMLTRTAAGGRYNGVPFHRVVPNFVVQGGDHFRRDGYGGPDVPIRSEFNRLRYRTGTAGMASSGKDTEGVQFFLTHSPTPHLDGRYTVFGQVVAGQVVVDALLQGDLLLRARLVPDPAVAD